jgi:hypothetical protein
MKSIGLFIFVLLFSHLIFGSPADSSESTGHLQNSIEGFWEIQLGSDQIFFFINIDSSEIYSGSVITYKDGVPISYSKLGEITFDNSVLRMVTNPQNNIVFEGIVDPDYKNITGNLHFSNGSKRQFNLKRYRGPEEKIIIDFISSSKNEKYKTLEQLPKLEQKPLPELDPNKYYGDNNNEKYLNSEDIIAVINRWHGDIYPDYENRSLALLTAFLLDPVTEEVSLEWKNLIKDLKTTEEKVRVINEWTISNLAYTQGDKQFVNYPGKDPWGTKQDGLSPTFKKLIPSEMKAMQLYTDKISGKCFTLVNLISSCFVQLGVDPDDIVILITKSGEARHAMALINYESEILLVNLIFVDFLKNHIDNDFGSYEIIGTYNHKYLNNANIEIRNTDLQNMLSKPGSNLVQNFMKYFKLEERVEHYNFNESLPYANRKDVYLNVFNEYNTTDWMSLSKYAYQSLLVKHPELYLEASLNTSGLKELAKTLRSPVEIIHWINNHIRVGSIFPDSDERIMTADQVLVFQQGGLKDKAVFAYTLLKLNGYQPLIKISKQNAFIQIDKQIFDFGNNKLINDISEEIILTLK